MSAARLVISGASRALCGQRFMHTTRAVRAVTTMQMPAMSPTMKEGGIAAWKFKEGDKFSAGDVLLEIETDKATIDVEAQEDGVLGKIILGDGSKNVAVGKPIALLAEEGDDISNLEIPKEGSSSSSPSKEQSSSASSSSTSSSAPPPASSQPPKPPTQSLAHGEHPTHSRPLFPSVLRLLSEHGIADGSKIKGTGLRGMLTKGDVLAHLGLASSPLGTFRDTGKKDGAVPKKPSQPASEVKKVLSAKEVRMAIVANLLEAGQPKVPAPAAADYDDILADYLPPAPAVSKSTLIPPSTKPLSSDYFAGVF